MFKSDVLGAINLALLTLLAGCAGSASSGSRDLSAVQITEYQGERLSDLGDFQENSIKGPQRVDIGSYRLRVTGLVDKPLAYSYSKVLSAHKSYTKLVTLDCVDGWAVKILWEGVLVADITDRAGILPAANTVIFHAHDGYTTSLPLAYVMDKNIMLAYKINGVELPPDRGFPFQLVAEDKWGYKWIKWVTEIELSDDPNYKGYWERAGYSNDADLDKPFFDR
ncbi:MAG: molybdopterin-dependent oxidoreductase [Dehalococcoidia bacterium]|nr:molybdopterin-dependent oxidoreductase [Dehalococcoidia bacterium]